MGRKWKSIKNIKKVVCIRTGYNSSDRKVEENSVYWAMQLDSVEMKETYCIYSSDYILRENYIGNFNHKYFISIAECREKQIKTVLDEGR